METAAGQGFRKAEFQSSLPGKAVRCGLCPRRCTIAEGKSGYCGVRRNEGGILRSLAYGHPVALQIDPIEKKPLCQFLPGSRTYSIGTFGCNLGCLFCQNSELSRGEYDPGDLGEEVKPEWLVADAVRNGCESIAFTYNEPTVFAEYALEIARCAHRAGLKTVLVSNGFITPEAAETLYPEIDAANFDMKGFSETFYKELCGGSLEPVLEAFRIFRRHGGHAEYTTLILPGKNDSLEMTDAWLDWVETHLDREVPLHFTAYHPAYRYHASPPTPPALLRTIREHAIRRGFPNIYLGNIR